MLGLYRAVVANGGLAANEAYDSAGRYSGGINWVRCVALISCSRPFLLCTLLFFSLESRLELHAPFQTALWWLLKTLAGAPRMALHTCFETDLSAGQVVLAARQTGVFREMRNFKQGHRATSIGTQLLSNYRKYLLAYERAWTSVDLPLASKLLVRSKTLAASPLITLSQPLWIVGFNERERYVWQESNVSIRRCSSTLLLWLAPGASAKITWLPHAGSAGRALCRRRCAGRRQ